MNKLLPIPIEEYLNKKGIEYHVINGELITSCIFNDCDADSHGNEAHLYFSKETGQYQCKKCGAEGNFYTLAKFFNENLNLLTLGNTNQQVISTKKGSKKMRKGISEQMVEKYHTALPDSIREYLNKRGIANAVIDTYKLGYGTFNEKHWITIPIKAKDGNYEFLKLRQDPEEGNDKITYPSGIEAQIFDWDLLSEPIDKLVICEGELDRLTLLSKGISAITSTHGAMTFKKEWVAHIPSTIPIYVCYDNDEAGEKGAGRVLQMLYNAGYRKLFRVKLPEEVGEHGDITDYFTKCHLGVEKIFSEFASVFPPRIDISQFEELDIGDIEDALVTIKNDKVNKVVTFLGELSAYAGDGQLNIIFSAPSSTGKSFIPLEIDQLFPKEDVLEVGYVSSTAFFHDAELVDKEKNEYLYDLSHKVLIFMDQLDSYLLSKIRPVLSHDKKEILVKITDRNQKFGHRTKNIRLRGFPSVIFCTANLNTDEQEITRAIMLSPEISDEKIRNAMVQSVQKESDTDAYAEYLKSIPGRISLMQRIEAIKYANVEKINIDDAAKKVILNYFVGNIKRLRPIHQRDIKWFIYMAKSFALLNLWWRKIDEHTIAVQVKDVESVIPLWSEIAKSRELHIQPYLYTIYKDIFVSLWNEKNFQKKNPIGISRQEILNYFYKVYRTPLNGYKLRIEMLPMLETAGLIYQEVDGDYRNRKLIFLTKPEELYSVEKGGVPSLEKVKEVINMVD